MARSKTPPKSVPVPPDAVRVWRGFRLSGLPAPVFFEKLGSVFMPSTVLIQQPLGLAAYLPTVLPARKPPGVPDEIALVFYLYQQAYEEAKGTVGGRVYSDLHGLVFDLGRSMSGFPLPFRGALEWDEKYYLFDKAVDWQRGHTQVFVGVRGGDGRGAFRDAVARWVTLVQAQDTKGPSGAIVSVSWDYVVYWENWSSTAAARRSRVGELAKLVEPVHHGVIAPFALTKGFWEQSQGVVVKGADSFNFQFRRR